MLKKTHSYVWTNQEWIGLSFLGKSYTAMKLSGVKEYTTQ